MRAPQPSAGACLTRPLVALLACAALFGCKRGRLLSRGDAAAVVVVAPDASVPMPMTDEVEPNDLAGAAQPVVIADEVGVTVKGTLTPSRGKVDVDLFRLIVGSPDDAGVPAEQDAGADGGTVGPALTLSLELTPAPELACVLQVADARGQPIVTSAASPGERCLIANASIVAGATVIVKVRAGGKRDLPADASYALTARVHAAEAGDEREPNDDPAMPSMLVAPTDNAFEGRAGVEERAGFFGWPQDVDVWSVPLEAWPPDVLMTVELEGVEGVEASVAVTDAAGRTLASSRGRAGDRVVLRQLAAPAPAPDGVRAARVIVKAERGSRADRRYVLRVRQDAAEPGSEREPNDDVARATSMPEGVAHGYLTAGDVDVYRVELDRPVELDVRISPVERVDSSIALLTADGATLATADGRRRGAGERLPNAFVERGPVFVRVSARRGDANPDLPYTLEVRPSEPVPNGEREPNDLRERATPLPLGAVGTGVLLPTLDRGDVDCWTVALPADAAKVELAVRGPRATASELAIETTAGRSLAKIPLRPGEEARRSVGSTGEANVIVKWRAVAARGGRAVGDVPAGAERYELVVGAAP